MPRRPKPQNIPKDNPLKVALVLHGNLGDKSFFDSAAAGMEKAKAELPVEVKIIEAGYDRCRGSRRSPTPPTPAMTSSSPAPST